MFKRMDKMVEPKDAPKTPETPKTPESKPAEDKAETPATNGETKPPEGEVGKDGKRPNPWKMYEEKKSALAKAESEVSRLSKLIQKPEDREAEIKRFKEIEDHNKQLLEHLRYVDYQKHPEFAEKYEKPYVDNWNKIMRRLSGVSVDIGDGTKRPVEPGDIAAISRLPADQAIELAEQKFGKLGPWVAERVEELRQLDEAKHEALEKVKKEGLERQTQMTDAQKIHEKQMNDYLAETWSKASAEIETHSRYGEYFKPKEGDDEFNARLESATEKVDKFWGKNPKASGLTPDQRAEIVKAHAAIRNRARGFGTQNLIIGRLRDENARLKQENEQFKASVPKADGSQPATNGVRTSDNGSFDSRLEAMMDRIGSKAK